MPFERRAESEVNAAAFGFMRPFFGVPRPKSDREADPFHVFLPEFVLPRIGERIPPFPEKVDEAVAFAVVCELGEDISFALGDDRADDLQPLLVPGIQVPAF
jgi:hypothetical protein